MWDAVTAPHAASRWAVIKDARRRQRRRQRRMLLLAASLAAAVAWLIADTSHTVPPPAAPGIAVATVEQAPVAGIALDTTTLGGNVWVLSCTRHCSSVGPMTGIAGELTELAAGSGRVLRQVPVGDPMALTSGAGAIWIAHFNTGRVTRVDPRTGKTTATIQLRLPRSFHTTPRWTRFQPSGIDFGAGGVWVSTAFGYVAAINPRTDRLARLIRTSSEATSTAAAAGVTWVADELAGVGTFGPSSGRVVNHPIDWAGQPVSVDTVGQGGGLIWAWGSGDNPKDVFGEITIITAINPRTGRIVHQWPEGSAEAMLVGDGGAFVGGGNHGQITHLTPNGRTETLAGPDVAHLTSLTRGAIWAITQRGRLLRIGLERR